MGVVIMGIGALGTMAGAVYGGSLANAIQSFHRSTGEPPYVNRARYRVSLLVPAYNESKYIGRLIRSAHQQTEPIHEIIVADCSDPFEGTAEIVNSLGGVVVPAKRGNISASRNIAAEASTGEVFLFADADIHLSNNIVEIAIDALESGKVAVHPKDILYDSLAWNLVTFKQTGFLRKVTNTSRCLITTRDTWEAVGGYDEDCNPITSRCREDLDFGKRIARAYGRGALGVLPTYIGTSARRQKKLGFTGWAHFSDPVRAAF